MLGTVPDKSDYTILSLPHTYTHTHTRDGCGVVTLDVDHQFWITQSSSLPSGTNNIIMFQVTEIPLFVFTTSTCITCCIHVIGWRASSSECSSVWLQHLNILRNKLASLCKYYYWQELKSFQFLFISEMKLVNLWIQKDICLFNDNRRLVMLLRSTYYCREDSLAC